jgi:alpha-tubulin suppressor-like RCC1 family protein
VSAEDGSACGLTNSGVVYCWGYNGYGQLGTGTTTNSPTPVAVTGGLVFATLSVGGGFTCGITTSGAAYCWGLNQFAGLGAGILAGPEQCNTTTGPVACSTKPVAVAGGITFTTVSAGKFSACGLTSSGAAYCWGADYYGLLAADSGVALEQCVNAEACSTRPLAVAGGFTFATVSVGEYSACGVTTSGAAYCWGSNFYGQLGNGTTTNSPKPTAVAGGLTFTTISAEYSFACGVTTSGAAYCWGLNWGGELGAGTTTNSAVPVAAAGGLTFKAVSTGGGFACGATTSNIGYCWGANTYGQLGNGTAAASTTPVGVAGGHAFSALSAAGYSSFFAPPVYPFFACGVTTSGAAYCWGTNAVGELGTGTTGGAVLVPTRVVL